MKNILQANELIHESSPYLLEHAHNPVHWYPWGKKALEKAKIENKPLIISIGYAACHWCHVMERESYSDARVADFMNEHFVSIKVDREERPDIDQIYMHAVQLITGSGGWPLNAFALPDGRPFYAATYFPKNHWLELLQQVEKLYLNDYDNVLQQAIKLTSGINIKENLDLEGEYVSENYEKIYQSSFENFIKIVDFDFGGYSATPKFPMPIGWEFLFQYYFIKNEPIALNAVNTSLEKMALGGIYDQIGGGFARYSTDAEWKVPHFEKMLYDNAQLVSLYSHSYQLNSNPHHAEIITETLAFIERELTNREGGFYSSLNADSEGEEGKYYLWSQQEIAEVLGHNDAYLICAYYQVFTEGEVEGKNVLFPAISKEEFSKKSIVTVQEFEKILAKAKKKLLAAREKRERPSIDDKTLTSWNAMMLKAYLDAFRALGAYEYLNTAIKNARFLETNLLREDGSLFRNYKNGKAAIPAFLDDYALLTQAFIELYQLTFDIHWLDQAMKITDYALIHFKDNFSPMFYYTSDLSEDLVARKMEISDNVIPSSNSVMAHNLYELGILLDKPAYTEHSNNMLLSILGELATGGPYFANWAMLLGKAYIKANEVAIIGEDAIILNHEIQQFYLPTSIFSGGTSENLPLLKMRLKKGKTMIYVCNGKNCKRPVERVSEAIDLIL